MEILGIIAIFYFVPAIMVGYVVYQDNTVKTVGDLVVKNGWIIFFPILNIMFALAVVAMWVETILKKILEIRIK